MMLGARKMWRRGDPCTETTLMTRDPDRLARSLLLEAELVRILGELDLRGIPAIVLKGVPLALRLFRTIDARDSFDNDVLVRRRDAREAYLAMARAGYRSIDGRTIERQLDADFQYRMARPVGAGGEVSAELHWSAFPVDLYPVDEEILWTHSESFDLGRRWVRVFDRPLTLIHLAAHFAQHLFAVRSILDDVAMAWNRWGVTIDRDELGALARTTGQTAVLDFALGSAADLGILALPAPELRSPRAARLRRLLPAEQLFTPRPEVDHVRMLLALLLVNPRRIPRWARNLLFPPIENMSVIVGRPISPALYLRYFTRPLRPLARVLGKNV
jgi:Uncharacterised nucleotidyltransferase